MGSTTCTVSSALTTTSPNGKPDVLVDFVFDQGLLWIAVCNVGQAAAHNVVVTFPLPLMGLGGKQDFAALSLFRNLSFLPAGKRIETFFDDSAAFFRRGGPTQVITTIMYKGPSLEPYAKTLVHDLQIYKDISYVVRRSSPQE